MNAILITAAILSAAVCLLHTFGGGKAIARPLLNLENLDPTLKYLAYFCWHITTITLAILALMYAVASVTEHSAALVWIANLMVAGIFLLGITLPPLKGQSYKTMPQGWLFLPILALGITGGVV